MPLSALRDDALRVRDGRTEVRVSLPWIRSLPVASLLEPVVHLDGRRHVPLIALGPRRVSPTDLTAREDWWYLQDRMLWQIPDAVTPGTHEVAVSFALEIPYLPGGPDQPLRLPFSFTRELEAGTSSSSVSLDVGSAS